MPEPGTVASEEETSALMGQRHEHITEPDPIGPSCGPNLRDICFSLGLVFMMLLSVGISANLIDDKIDRLENSKFTFKPVRYVSRTRSYFISLEPYVSCVQNKELKQTEQKLQELFPTVDFTTFGKCFVRYGIFSYKDSSFSDKIPGDVSSHGFIGAVVKGIVGDVVSITFRNQALEPMSLFPQCLEYDFVESVSPGVTAHYSWKIMPAHASPSRESPLSFLFYYSNLNRTFDMASGVFAPLVLSRNDAFASKQDAYQVMSDSIRSEMFIYVSYIDEIRNWNIKRSLQLWNLSGTEMNVFLSSPQSFISTSSHVLSVKTSHGSMSLTRNQNVRVFLSSHGSSNVNPCEFTGGVLVSPSRTFTSVTLTPGTNQVLIFKPLVSGNHTFSCDTISGVLEFSFVIVDA